MTLFGATTNPLPSSTFWQLVATPRILRTLGRVAATTGSAASAASGASTLTIGVRPNGSSTVGRAGWPRGAPRKGWSAGGGRELPSSPDGRVGTRRNHSGATSFTVDNTREPR